MKVIIFQKKPNREVEPIKIRVGSPVYILGIPNSDAKVIEFLDNNKRTKVRFVKDDGLGIFYTNQIQFRKR